MAILSAGINFGKPATEFIVESDESGVIQSCRNVVTGVEYAGGGGGGGSDEKAIALMESFDEETSMVSLPLTWRQIKDNFDNKIYMIIYSEDSDGMYPYLDYISSVTDDGHGGYAVASYNGTSYFTDDENGYPGFED